METMIEIAQKEQASQANSMGRWVDGVVGPGYRQYCAGDKWHPAINVYEDDHGFDIVVELAGVSPDAIELHVDSESLLLKGSRPTPRPPDNQELAHMHLMEIDHGAFHREIQIPESVDPDALSASYRCGLLWIRLAKVAAS